LDRTGANIQKERYKHWKKKRNALLRKKFPIFATNIGFLERKEHEMNTTAIRQSDILAEAQSVPREKATNVEEDVGQT